MKYGRHVTSLLTTSIVDDKYLAKVPGSPFRLGQRLNVSEQYCRQAIADTDTLRAAIAGLIT